MQPSNSSKVDSESPETHTLNEVAPDSTLRGTVILDGPRADETDPGLLERALEAHGSHLRRFDNIVLEPTRKTAALPKHSPQEAHARYARIAIATVVLGAFAILVVRGIAYALASGSLIDATLALGGSAFVAYFAAVLVHATRYKPFANISNDRALPRVTVIIPAYNEGKMVRVSLNSALANDYPADKLEIIAIDDGSKDDTWLHIQAVAAQNPGRIKALRQPQNAGKREALRRGFEEATGDFMVTVDSDSKIGANAIRQIIAPMVHDSEIGAVAGRVEVLNRNETFLTKLLAARFFITFDLARAAQSRFGAVLCTPGALSAYRKRGVDEVVVDWSNQTFGGKACTIAEDRALTTWLLKAGYRSVYQSTAAVETVMPTEISRICRMLIRWERGNIREDLVMMPTLFTRWRKRDQAWPTLEIAMELLQYPFSWLGLTVVAYRALHSPSTLLQIAAFLVFGCVVQSVYCLRSNRLSDFVYGTLYALVAIVGLQWVFPYSLATVRDGRWMTR